MNLKEEITQLIYSNSKDTAEGVLIDFKMITLLIENIAAISVTRCCEELKDKKVFTFEEWLEVNYTQKGYIYLSKQAESAWYTIREVKKQYNIEYNL